MAKRNSKSKKPKRLFVDDGRSHGTVILNSAGEPEKEFEYMAEAFVAAAKAAVAKLKRDRHFGLQGVPLDDFKAYPALYLYRHALELSMKAILVVGTKMLRLRGQAAVDQTRLLSTHDLDWLRGEVERVFAVYGWSWDCQNKHFGSAKDLREVIAEFQKVDGGSYAFRYPMKKTGEASLETHFRFNVFHFAEILDSLLPTLAGAAIGSVYEYDDAMQAWGEAHEEQMRWEAENYEPPDYEPYDE